MRPVYQKCEASVSPSLCPSLFLSLPLLAFICWLFFSFSFLFCGLIVITGSRLRELRKAKQRFLKRFLKGLLESVAWALICLIPPNNTGTCHCCRSLPYHATQPVITSVLLSPPLFHFCLILFLLSCACSFYLIPSHVLKAVLPLLTSVTYSNPYPSVPVPPVFQPFFPPHSLFSTLLILSHVPSAVLYVLLWHFLTFLFSHMTFSCFSLCYCLSCYSFHLTCHLCPAFDICTFSVLRYYQV